MLDRKLQSCLYPESTGDVGRDRNARTLQITCLLFAFAIALVAVLDTIARERIELPGPIAFSDVVNRSNQMGTIAVVVKDRRDADFACQPPGRVIRCFFPHHDGILFDRLPVLSQDHRRTALG
jgi:hypothetical protein